MSLTKKKKVAVALERNHTHIVLGPLLPNVHAHTAVAFEPALKSKYNFRLERRPFSYEQ